MDYEATDTYSVEVTVSDGKDAAGTADTAVDDTIRVTIMVTDVNEGPTFTSADPLILTVEENTVSNANIGSVVATDPDTKATNADWNSFTYGFKNPSDADFTIDADTGLLTTKVGEEYNYEKQRDYEVIVTVSDEVANEDPDDPDDEIRVIIRVEDDSSDNAAVVNSAPYFNSNEGDGLLTDRTVEENTAADMNIGEPVGATDDDTGDDLTFAFDPVNNDDFAIDAATGQLKTKAGLDFEVKDTYSVKVTVSDGKDDTGTRDTGVDDTITVKITVEDVNEGPDVHQ